MCRYERLIKEDCEQCCTCKFNKLDEMDQVLKKHKTLQLTQCEEDNLSSSITVKEIEFIILKIPQKKSPCPDSFSAEFY